MDDRTHLIITVDPDEGWTAESPQLPGFVYGRQTRLAFTEDLPGVLREVEAREPIVQHVQERFLTPDDHEILVRVAQDRRHRGRVAIAQNVVALLQAGDPIVENGPPTRTGEYLIITVLPEDTIGWVVEQFNQFGEAVLLAIPMPDEGPNAVLLTSLATEGAGSDEGTETLASQGLDMDSTIGELLRTTKIRPGHSRRLLVTT